MWIIQNNHPLKQCLSAQAFVESKEELSEVSDLTNSCMWKSKPLSLKTWSQKWKRVFWLPLLFGRTLKQSHRNYFETRLIFLLLDTRASLSAQPVSEKELMIQDTSFHISQGQLTLFGLPSASSRMLEVTSQWGSEKSLKNWNAWVTECIGEYSVRRKQAQLTREKEFLSWQSGEKWTTPISSDSNRNTKFAQGGAVLKGWKTPSTQECEGGEMKELRGDAKYKLRDQVNWGTTQYQDPDSLNRHGNPRGSYPERLNPAWVCQLMGITFEKTFFAHLETPSIHQQQNLPGTFLVKNMDYDPH